MNVNFYVTCIADVVKSGVAKNTVLLLEKLNVRKKSPTVSLI